MLRLFFLHIWVSITSSPVSAVLSHPARHHFQRCFVRPTAAGTDEPALRAALWESSSQRHSFVELKLPSSQAVLRYRTAIATFYEKRALADAKALFVYKGSKGY